MEKKLWWQVNLEMHDHYYSILLLAVMNFSDKEIGNFGCLAEAIWAEREGLS